MEIPTGARRAYSDQIISRLRRQYVEQCATPGPNGAPLTFQKLRQLCQYVIAEGYGEQTQADEGATGEQR